MAAGYDGRGARFPLTIVRGADLAFELTVTAPVESMFKDLIPASRSV